ncbi:hypothetical protein CDD81_67 [Ophiocordyceps australis]|uniref:Acyltransferase 3 domain-containing protein n=1 Tax=Ophiocordyceps australis TaxID=1399860 RepID=A0A2C5YKB1_9HYPO|nr:hypothetical protein CDD81_67 [Ophiocordyceps australis]
MSWPCNNFDKTPGILILWRHIMEPFWNTGDDLWIIFSWYALSSAQTDLAFQQIKFLQNILVTSLVQYLGDISYMLYLIHGPVVRILTILITPYLWSWFGGKVQAGLWGLMVV